jgi:hypothetical protein
MRRYAAGDVRRLVVLLVPALACAALAGCDKESPVHVAFRPAAGAVYRYEIKVQSVTTTVLGDQPADRSTDDVTLQSTETVVASGPDSVSVRVDLHRDGSPDRTFQVRLDRNAQLAGVDAVDGLPPDVLGSGGFPEFLPAAATAPPDKALKAGTTWTIDARPALGGDPPVHLQGTGKLEKVTTEAGTKVASITARTSLPLSSTTPVGDATATLQGTEVTDSTASRALADGSVQSAQATSTGTFQLVVSPKAGGPAAPVNGSMTVEVRSQTRRLPDVEAAAKKK